MDEEKQFFKIPMTQGEEDTYDFYDTDENMRIYEELNAINEEIEACRLRNC